MKRITITLPDEQVAAIEEIRRRHRIPRSRVVQQAIALSLAQRQRAEEVRRYEEGYRKKPEGDDSEAYARATAEVLKRERWR